MKIGAFVGKFLPPHLGHVSQIEKCLSLVDELYVIVAEDPARSAAICKAAGLDPIEGELRVKWLTEHFKDNAKIKVCYFDEGGLKAFPEGLKEWSERFKSKFTNINVKFADETYRELNEKYFPECQFIAFDRTVIPISATMVRNDLKANFNYIIEEGREYFKKYL